MKPEGRLEMAAGWASETGRRADNQDFCGIYLGTASERARHGLIAAVADGVGGAKAGRMAAELAVRALIEGYYDQPDTIGSAAAANRVLVPFNRWLHTMGRTDTMAHAATTFTALMLRGRRAHVVHVGDTRAWLFRDEQLRLLTSDHVRSHPDQRHILYRALGIEETLRLDHHELQLAPHDRLLLTSDGVHGILSARQLARLAGERGSAESDAQRIVDAALNGGSQDNASAVLIDIVALPAPEFDAIADEVARLSILPPPRIGESVDGFRLDRQLADGRYTRLFVATDTFDGSQVVIKFPKCAVLSESGARLAFAREMLVAARVSSPFVGTAIPVASERQSRLYGVQPYYVGETLEARLGRPASLAAALAVAARLTRAVAALHKLDIVHRDLKPDNVILTEDSGLKLIDLGVARLPRVDDFAVDETPGTPSFLAPEMFEGNRGDPLTDQFALGVTLWRLFAGRFPYGEAEVFSRPRFDRPEPPSRSRPELPAWLDAALLRAVAVDPRHRFGDVVELLRALEGGAAVARKPARPAPLIERHPVRFWQAVATILAAALTLALAWR